MMENWKDIQGYEGIYAISDCGNVLSIRSGKNLVKKNTHGYDYVVLSVNGKCKTMRIHRLVALAFIPNPDNKPTVNHINEIKTDNRVCNLEWATTKEQNTHGTRIQRAREHTDYKARKIDYSVVASKHDYKKLAQICSKAVHQFDKNGSFIKTYQSLIDASKETGARDSDISSCLRGKRKTAGGWIWKNAE